MLKGLCIWIDSAGHADKQITVSHPLIPLHTDTQTVCLWINHRLKVSGRVGPVFYCGLSNFFRWHPGEHRKIAIESMRISVGKNQFTLFLTVMPRVA